MFIEEVRFGRHKLHELTRMFIEEVGVCETRITRMFISIRRGCLLDYFQFSFLTIYRLSTQLSSALKNSF